MREVDRRDFLRSMLGTAFAIAATDKVLVPAQLKINASVREITAHPTGNAGMRDEIEDLCKEKSDMLSCREEYYKSSTNRFNGIVMAPITEEMVFRALPSAIISEKGNVGRELIFGTAGLGMTRRELLAGVISSLIFGGVHNITAKGFDTNTIPASQTFVGIVSWYLQRKFGFFANTASHMMSNFRGYTS